MVANQVENDKYSITQLQFKLCLIYTVTSITGVKLLSENINRWSTLFKIQLIRKTRNHATAGKQAEYTLCINYTYICNHVTTNDMVAYTCKIYIQKTSVTGCENGLLFKQDIKCLLSQY